jgi:serine/threonine-protein kinase
VSDLPSELAAGLAGRYTLERPLGRGGMATVFLARDLKHDRPVALKVLHPELAASLGPERFQREIRLAARLQHPHICGVLDSGITDPGPGSDHPYYWFAMPYLEGESLRDRLNRERQLPVDEAVRIAREVAEGLDYAHRQGVVHRDIKPENILLTERHALVADFGIARALQSSAVAGTALTDTGMAIGTPAYMSPEQASGGRDVDARSDIYALGCLLYEMLAGEAAFTGPTAQAIMIRAMTETPRPIHPIRAAVPEALDGIIRKAMARSPMDRYAGAAEFSAALGGVGGGKEPAAAPVTTPIAPARSATTAGPRPGRQARRTAVIFGVGLLVGLGVLFAWRRMRPPAESGRAGVRRLAVIPFENLGAPEDEYFADGMTDEVRGKLATLPGLQVTASRSAAEYKRSSKTAEQIARELGVDYLLVGKIRWEKGAGQSRVRVSPELIQVSSTGAATTRWQQPFDATLTDVFQVQADIAGRVAQALNLALGQTQQRTLETRPTQNLAAYDAYLQGRELARDFGSTSAADLRRAVEFLDRAVALDSSFALAWALVSRVHAALYYNSTPTPSDSARARAAADRAMALDPHAPSSRLAAGDFYNYVLGDWSRALEQYDVGRGNTSQDAELLASAAFALYGAGRWEEAMAALQQAQALDPRSSFIAHRLTRALLWLRRYPEASQAADRALALAPGVPSIIQDKAMVLLAQGDLRGARAAIHAAPSQVDPTSLVAYFAVYWDLYWVLDDQQQQLVIRLSPTAFGDDRLSWGLVLAQTYALLGDQAKARIYADSARLTGEAQLSASQQSSLPLLVGLAEAYAGRAAEAVRLGEEGAARSPVSRDAYAGPYNQHLLARIYVRTSQPEKAISILEQLVKVPYFLSPAWLRIDPEWKPLHGNPRFERLIAAKG